MSSHPEFSASEYHADTSFRLARYRFEGSTEDGWTVLRNGEVHLELGPGYLLLRTISCGICSTDLDRHFLPFPLPQVTGHELVVRDEEGRRYVVEINASHAARGVDTPCPFCDGGLATHCPDRRVLGIHDLPGGFGPWVLVPVDALLPLPDDLPLRTALLIEPFAAALHAVERVEVEAGETIAVLGPRRLGLLAIAALAGHRRRSGIGFEILAVARHPALLALARELGATGTVLSEGDGESLDGGIADVVIDTTGSPKGLELAIRLARREVHLKSTHGQPAVGLAHTTELVVDELALRRLPDEAQAGARWLARLGRGRRPRVAWLTGGEPPAWMSEASAVARGEDAVALQARLSAEPPPAGIPRVDVAVVGDASGIDRAIRPSASSETSLLRPCGEIALASGADTRGSSLLYAVASRGLRLSGSRCGDFRTALDLVVADPALRGLGERLVTHRFAAPDIARAFETARAPGCIKAVIDHPDSG